MVTAWLSDHVNAGAKTSKPDGRIYSIDVCYSSSSFFSQRLPSIYVPFKSVWMCIRVGLNIISCSLFHRSLIRLFEWYNELVWHSSKLLLAAPISLRTLSVWPQIGGCYANSLYQSTQRSVVSEPQILWNVVCEARNEHRRKAVPVLILSPTTWSTNINM